jgi:undecaprenyl-diphosphatase
VDRRLAWFIVLASIPGAIAGFLLEGKIEDWFHQPNAPHDSTPMLAMGVIIALLGTALFIAERTAKHLRGMKSLTLKDAILIGVAQAFAVFPGVSRSGATITAGLFLNLTRETAARFSFLLSAPLIAGAGAKSMLDVARKGMPTSELIFFGVGFLVAMLSGYLCIRFLLRFLKRNSTDLFVYYRWLLAGLVIAIALMRG